MLHMKKVLGAKPKEHVEAELEPMYTPWGESLDVEHVLEEHPNPQFARESYQSLNGLWKCAFADSAHKMTDDFNDVVRFAAIPEEEEFVQDIIVPFSPESLLSRVSRQLQPTEIMWYRRTFDSPVLGEGERCLLHFEAVDYACGCFVNGTFVGSHVGGYLPFCFDVTDCLKEGANVLMVSVADPSEFGGRVRGKQRFDRGDIWYTAQSGIWQSVWMETVPSAHVESIVIEPDAQTGVLAIGACLALANAEANDLELRVDVFDDEGSQVAGAVCRPTESSCALATYVPDARLWSPEEPYLYRLRITFGDDIVDSYCGFRTIEVRQADDGRKRVFLNGKPLFMKGVLDQAYWSDGLMTAPADEALVFDIEAMRDAGFNLMRKHIKVESRRWYYHCDRLGMLVLQDMVSGGSQEIATWHWSYKPTLFKVSWRHYRDDKPSHQEKLGAGDAGYRKEWTQTCVDTVRLLGGHPCIIGWSLFNEGWGQFDARAASDMVRQLDSSRLIDATSGWYDQRCGDFNSVHNYFRDMKVWSDRGAGRAFFISEFGGFTHRVDGHAALEEAYGYEPYDDKDEWKAAVRALLAEVEGLEPKGLVGYIYTQVSDIEEETNGILTYDRRVNKFA